MAIGLLPKSGNMSRINLCTATHHYCRFRGPCATGGPRTHWPRIPRRCHLAPVFPLRAKACMGTCCSPSARTPGAPSELGQRNAWASTDVNQQRAQLVRPGSARPHRRRFFTASSLGNSLTECLSASSFKSLMMVDNATPPSSHRETDQQLPNTYVHVFGG